MSISDLYSSGLHKQQIGHFATIVRLALVDEVIDAKEKKLLHQLAKRLYITENEFKAILKNPDKYPVNPPVSYEKRVERLYDLTRMLFLDRIATIDKVSMMNRVAVGLGFPISSVREVVKEAIKFFVDEPPLEDFRKRINYVKA